MPVVKDSAYFFDLTTTPPSGKLAVGVRARIANIFFRLWDPLTTWLKATADRLAEVEADVAQTENDFFIDSAQGTIPYSPTAPLDRRLTANEGIARILATGANDGTITLSASSAPLAPVTYAIGALTLSPPQDPNNPTAVLPVYVNTIPITIGPGFTSWTPTAPAWQASPGGTLTNLPIGTALLLTGVPTLLQAAVVAQVGGVLFAGTGLNDAASGGSPNGADGANPTYHVVIDSIGGTDTFKWQVDGGAFTTGVPITGAAQTLSGGVTIRFGAITGHTLADGWTFGTGAFINGTDTELDAPYRIRAKAIISSRTLGTSPAIIGAALSVPGVAFADVIEDFGNDVTPVTLYVATAAGTLSAALAAQVLRVINGDKLAVSPLPMIRAAGINVAIGVAVTIRFTFSIKLVLRGYVVDGPAGALRSNLEGAIAGALTAYVQGLNVRGADRTLRLNLIKDLIMNYRGLGLVDLDDATYIATAAIGAGPATPFTGNYPALTGNQMAVMGPITFLTPIYA